MKKFLLYFFASAGIIGLTFKIIVFYQNEKLAAHYWKNCQNVEIGMTLEQARAIIGDLRYASWTQDKNLQKYLSTNGKEKLPIAWYIQCYLEVQTR